MVRKIKNNHTKKINPLYKVQTKTDILSDIFFENLNKSFYKNKINNFKKYLKKFNHIKHWSIISDYCEDDINKCNNVYSFVLYPICENPTILLKKIKEKIPVEIKNIKGNHIINPITIDFFKNNDAFVFNFIFEKNFFKEIYYDQVLEREQIIRNINIIEKNWSDEHKKIFLPHFKNFSEILNRKNPNLIICKKVYFISVMLGFLLFQLKISTDIIESISWFPDRDKTTSFNNGFIYSLSFLFYDYYMKKIKHSPLIFYVTNNPNNEKPFYDEFIKIPDYFCGTLASLDLNIFSDNSIQKKTLLPNNIKPKFLQFINEVIKNNDNIVNFIVKPNGCAILNIVEQFF